MTQKHTVMLIIMDGFGCRDEKKDNNDYNLNLKSLCHACGYMIIHTFSSGKRRWLRRQASEVKWTSQYRCRTGRLSGADENYKRY